MKKLRLKRTAFLILTSLGIVTIFDLIDRGLLIKNTPKFEIEDLTFLSEEELDKEKYYSSFFNNPKYKFPRSETALIKLYRNNFLTSRLTGITVNSKMNNKLIAFFNDSDNFDWDETTWRIDESEYLLRFYDSKNNEIGKVYICLADCKMVNSDPFTPNMKFGNLSISGYENLTEIIKQIETVP